MVDLVGYLLLCGCCCGFELLRFVGFELIVLFGCFALLSVVTLHVCLRLDCCLSC